MRFSKLIILLASMLLFAIPVYASNSIYKVSPKIPLDSWTYPALDRVVALCSVEDSLSGLRPLTRMEAARLVSLAALNAALYEVPPMVKQQLKRLQDEFRPELEYLADESGTVAAPSKLLRSAQLRYTYQDGKESTYPGTDAHQYALNYNSDGRDYDNHHNGEFTLLGDALLFDQLLLSWQPMLRARDDNGFDYQTVSAVAAVSFKGIELSAGRQSLWWGQGRHSSLILTNNAEPLDMVRLTNPTPLQLPWLFKYLGPFGFDLFASRLDKDRDVSKPYFGGLRIKIKPAHWLELGATRTVMFGGEGVSKVNVGDFLGILGGENLVGDDDNSNSIAGIDGKLIFPVLWNTQIYGELVGEDEAGHFISRNSYMVGAYLPQLDPAGRFSLRTEYADTTRIGGGSPVLYRHGLYKSGYIYKGQIMGHHVGSDSTDLSFELGIDCTESLFLALLVDFEERGKSLDLQEKHAQVDFTATWWLNPQLSVEARSAYDHVRNFNNVDGNENFYFGSLALNYGW